MCATRTLIAATLIPLLLTAPSAAAPMFMGLGNLSGGAFTSEAFDVSADGLTIVGSTAEPGGGFVWDAANGMRSLHPSAERATAVSADGSKTLVIRFTAPSRRETFLYERSGSFTYLGTTPGGLFFGRDISADGSMVVGGGGNEAFLWDDTNGMRSLGWLPGDDASNASAISADGTTVVGSSRSRTNLGQAFVWDEANGIRGLGYLPGGLDSSSAIDVSADGSKVVGGSAGEAFIWDAANGMLGLGVVPGGSISVALAISDDGTTVVGSGSDGSRDELGTAVFHALIWDDHKGMRRLVTELAAVGVEVPTGWSLHSARGVSANGLTIVGTGRNPSGVVEAWIAVIPEPNTGLLLAYGLLGIAARRRHRVVVSKGVRDGRRSRLTHP